MYHLDDWDDDDPHSSVEREQHEEIVRLSRELAHETSRADTYKVIVIIIVFLFGAWLIAQTGGGGSGSAACDPADGYCDMPDPNDQWDFPPMSRP